MFRLLWTEAAGTADLGNDYSFFKQRLVSKQAYD